MGKVAQGVDPHPGQPGLRRGVEATANVQQRGEWHAEAKEPEIVNSCEKRSCRLSDVTHVTNHGLLQGWRCVGNPSWSNDRAFNASRDVLCNMHLGNLHLTPQTGAIVLHWEMVL